MKSNKGLILIVDDLPENVMVVEKTLQREGYRTEIATTGQEAIERFSKIKPDLILLDILMPKIDGFEVCRNIKAMPASKNVPIIFLTALSEPKYIVQGFEAGSVDFITKPFNLTELLARVQTHIELKKSHEENEQYIAKLRKANQDLNAVKNQLTEMNSNKDKFFSIIAHDLRNPFLGFYKLIDLIHKEFDNIEREELRTMISDISKSSEKLNKLLENLLTWSRIQLGKVSVRREQVNLKQMVELSANMFIETAKSKNISIKNEVDEVTEAFADIQILNTVLRNIISNAIKFTNVLGEIIIYTSSQNGNVLLTIEDNGIGISSDELTKLFLIETQVIKTGTAGEFGTGLSLILSKDLLDQMGASIAVKSQVDIGTKFIIRLPAVKPDSSAEIKQKN
jgi:signal transduction histidine kinase